MRLGLLSRSGESHPLGKLTYDLPRTKVCDDAGQVVAQRAHALGMSLAEYVRWVMTIHALGPDHVESVLVRRVEVAGRIGKAPGSYGDPA